MNNLKRILSLALASVMVMGMMVVGASAAEFSDNDDIIHDAAVDTMSALGIIKGMDDGSFNPNGDVTRAQMAKMITVALNGKEPNLGKPTTATFKDSASHWALEYIEYCANLGIIAGRSTDTFDPEGKVTAAEAAKMMLVALGFDADVFNLVGAEWSKNTMTLASNLRIGTDPLTAKTLNLFGGLTGIGANTPLNRDQAAQLIYNGIQSQTVVMSLKGVTSGTTTGILGAAAGQTPEYEWSLTGPTLLKSKFNATVVEGVLTDAKYTKATTSTAAYWDYTVTAYDADEVAKTPETFTFNKDVSDSFMQTVRVVYKNEKGSRKTVLAITSVGDNVLETCAYEDLYSNADGTTLNDYELGSLFTRTGTGTSAVVTETPYDVSTLPEYTFLNEDNETRREYDTTRLIDSNGDGRIDCIVVIPVTVAKVGAVRPTYIQVSGLATNVTLASNKVAEGLEVNDYVTYTVNPETGVITVEKAEIVNGTMTASKDHTVNANGQWTSYDMVQVGGEWYVVVENYNTGNNVRGLVSKEVDLVLVAGYVVDGKAVTSAATASDAVMAVAKATTVTENSTSVDAGTAYLEVRVLKADGTTEVLRASTGTGTNGKIRASDVDLGQLYTYTTNPTAPGCVILTKYNPQTPAGQEKYYAATTDASAQNGAITINNGLATQGATSYRFADDAKIFVFVGNGTAPTDAQDTTNHLHKWAVVSGADVNKWGSQTTNNAQSVLYADRAANGFVYVKEGAVILPNLGEIPGATGTTKIYGYVTGTAYFTTSADGKTNYIAVPVFDGAANKTVLAKTIIDNTDGQEKSAVFGNETKFPVGSLVSFKDNGDGTVNTLTKLTQENDGVIAWDGVSTIKFKNEGSGAEFTVDDKTVIVYVDGSKKAGVEDGNIIIADFVNPYETKDGLYANVYYVDTTAGQNGAKGHVDVLVLDTTNRIRKSATANEIVPNTTAAVEKGSLEDNANEIATTGGTVKANNTKAISGKAEDIITYGTGNSKATLYTLGDVAGDLGLTKSNVYYLFTVTYDYADSEKTYTLTKTVNNGTKPAPSATATAENDPAILIILCGNGEDGEWTIKESNNVLLTLKWDHATSTMTATVPTPEAPSTGE